MWPAQAFLSRQGDNLYFNEDSKLYSMSLTGGDPKAIYTQPEGSGKICGAMVYEDGTARLNIAADPSMKTDAYITVPDLVKVVRVTGVSLNQSTASLEQGGTLKLEAAVVPADADNQRVIWRSDDVSVASVAADGTVTALKAGTATITVTTADGGKMASCTVTVTHTHDLVRTAGVDAACETDGQVEHYTCSKCGKIYADAAGTVELTNIVIAATGHTPGAWSHNETQHWGKCTVCGEEIDSAGHIFRWVVDKAATEDETGLSHEECVCGRRRSENTVMPKLDHVHVGIQYHAAVAATCTAKGSVEYWTCSSAKCAGKYYGDSACQTVLTVIETPVNPANHAGAGFWTVYGDKHIYTCSCGVKTIDDVHVYDNAEDNTCNLCGYKRFYVVTSGAGAAYELGSGSGLSITADGEFKFFQAVEVDGSIVDPANYEVREGSTIVTLKKAYLESLATGIHDIRVLYTDGKVASTKFAVEEEADTDDDDSSNNYNAASAENRRVTAPKTGDNCQPAQLVMIIVICAAMGAGILISRRKNY